MINIKNNNRYYCFFKYLINILLAKVNDTDLFVVDEAFTLLGIDNSVTYIVIANNCIKTNEIKTNNIELVNYGLFTKVELDYLINNNIMNSAMNKLAYYNLINNRNKKIYKMKKR